MKLQKNRKNVFTPRKVKLTHTEEKRASKLVKGNRFGKRWFPYDK